MEQGIIVFLLNLVFDLKYQVSPDERKRGDSYDFGDKSQFMQSPSNLQSFSVVSGIKKFTRQNLLDIALRVEIIHQNREVREGDDRLRDVMEERKDMS